MAQSAGRGPVQKGTYNTQAAGKPHYREAQVISFESFKTEDGKPIYLQILDFIRRGAAAGTIADGDELPSRRVLSALLGINPNTVQKAFKLLEDEGLIESRAGSGSVMTLSPERTEKIREELLAEDIRGITGALKRTGVGREEALALIARYWDEPDSAEDARQDQLGRAETNSPRHAMSGQTGRAEPGKTDRTLGEQEAEDEKA